MVIHLILMITFIINFKLILNYLSKFFAFNNKYKDKKNAILEIILY